MKKLDHTILKVFLYGIPVVFMMALFASHIDTKRANDGSLFDFYNGFSGLAFGFWMLFSIYLSLRLLFSGKFRTEVLPRLTLFKERDERELLITARATRNSFLTTLALLIFLFCLSIFQMAVYRIPKDQAANGKTGTVTLGVNMNLTNHSSANEQETSALDYIRYSGLPVSNSAIILFLIFWQLGSYNYFMRRLTTENINLLEV